MESTTDRSAIREFRAMAKTWSHAVFVGLGGNYFYARPYLERFFRNTENVHFIDPDDLEAKNADRQWPNRMGGFPKVDIAANDWSGARVISTFAGRVGDCFDGRVRGCIRPTFVTDHLQDFEEGEGFCIVCLPDNDQARLQSCEMLEFAMTHGGAEYGAIVVAGTDFGRGQAYWGLMVRDANGVPYWAHDWRVLHEGDVTDDAGRPAAGCGQNPMDNMLTAAAVGLALEDLNSDEDTDRVREWYWGPQPKVPGNIVFYRREV